MGKRGELAICLLKFYMQICTSTVSEEKQKYYKEMKNSRLEKMYNFTQKKKRSGALMSLFCSLLLDPFNIQFGFQLSSILLSLMLCGIAV